MADPFEPIRQALLAAAPVTAIVGDRIEPLKKPQAGAEPSISLQLVETDPENHLQGHAGLDAARVRIECWHPTYDGALDLMNKARTAVAVADRVCVDELRDYDFEVKLYRFDLDFLVWV
jgi:hypothetical protein